MQTEVLIVVLVSSIVIGCKSKQQEISLKELPRQEQPDIRGALADSAKLGLEEHVKKNERKKIGKEKPEPPIPVEAMTRAQLNDYKKLLKESGYYDCCVEPSCRMCIFELEECPCEHIVKKKQPVCGECYDGWQAGKGKLKGVKTEDVTKQ